MLFLFIDLRINSLIHSFLSNGLANIYQFSHFYVFIFLLSFIHAVCIWNFLVLALANIQHNRTNLGHLYTVGPLKEGLKEEVPKAESWTIAFNKWRYRLCNLNSSKLCSLGDIFFTRRNTWSDFITYVIEWISKQNIKH